MAGMKKPEGRRLALSKTTTLGPHDESAPHAPIVAFNTLGGASEPRLVAEVGPSVSPPKRICIRRY
jgi:hypothetical protein